MKIDFKRPHSNIPPEHDKRGKNLAYVYAKYKFDQTKKKIEKKSICHKDEDIDAALDKIYDNK